MSEKTLSLQELFANAMSGKVQMHSALGTRDESKQTKQFTTRIQKMKTVCGLNHRILVMKDIVLPFNPFTGDSDEIYNSVVPFRPILLVSQVIAQIKDICAKDEALRETYEKMLGGKFSDGEEVTYEDYCLFKRNGFIKPRIMTYDIVSVNLNGRCGFPDFKQKYTVDSSQLNADKTYDAANAPAHHKLAVLFNAICREKWKEQEAQLKANNATEEQISNARRSVFSESPISFVKPQNLIPFFFYDLGKEFPEIKEENFMDVEKDIRYYSYTDKWSIAFEEALKDDSYDELIDFFDFTVKTPKSGSTSANGVVYADDQPNAIYQALSITITDMRKSISSGSVGSKKIKDMFEPTYNAICAYFLHSQNEELKEDGKSFEKIMAASNRFRPIDAIESNLLQGCHEEFSENWASSKFFTQQIRMSNNDILIAMNPANMLETAGYDESELQTAANEQASSLKGLISDANDSEDPAEFDLNELDLSGQETSLDIEA